jgi:hypothetical protein
MQRPALDTFLKDLLGQGDVNVSTGRVEGGSAMLAQHHSQQEDGGLKTARGRTSGNFSSLPNIALVVDNAKTKGSSSDKNNKRRYQKSSSSLGTDSVGAAGYKNSRWNTGASQGADAQQKTDASPHLVLRRPRASSEDDDDDAASVSSSADMVDFNPPCSSDSSSASTSSSISSKQHDSVSPSPSTSAAAAALKADPFIAGSSMVNPPDVAYSVNEAIRISKTSDFE